MTGDDVARNTELAGTAVGGMDEAKLEAAVDDLASELPDTEVVIETGDLTLTTTAGALGIGIDTAATTEVVLETGDDSPLCDAALRMAGFVHLPARGRGRRVRGRRATTTHPRRTRGRGPPRAGRTVLGHHGWLSGAVCGVDGVELTVEDVTGALPASLGDVSESISVTAERTVSRRDRDDASPAVRRPGQLAAGTTITVTAGEQTFEFEGQALVDGVSVIDPGDLPRLTVSEDVIGQQIAAQDRHQLEPDRRHVHRRRRWSRSRARARRRDLLRCGATEAIVDALLAGQTEVDVPARTLHRRRGRRVGIDAGREPAVVSEFTTNHPCCQGRVGNIQPSPTNSGAC